MQEDIDAASHLLVCLHPIRAKPARLGTPLEPPTAKPFRAQTNSTFNNLQLRGRLPSTCKYVEGKLDVGLECG
jgi:hypothetical protein